MANVAADRAVLTGLAIVIVWAIVSLLAGIVSQGGNLSQLNRELTSNPEISSQQAREIARAVGTFLPVLSGVAPLVWWIVISCLMYAATAMLGGRGPFGALLATVGVAAAPYAVLSLINLVLGLIATATNEPTAAALFNTLGNLLGLIALVWHIWLVILGASLSRDLSTGQATGSCAISCVGCGILLVALVFVIVIVAAAAVGGATGSGGLGFVPAFSR